MPGLTKDEHIVEQGDVVLLKLVPVDPRSLMQGDHLDLHRPIYAQIREALQPDAAEPE